MKKIVFSLLLAVVTLYPGEGEKLFDSHCISCHIKTKPTKEMKSSFIAPPISGVVKNIKRAFEEDRQATIAFIVSYTLNPKEQDAKCKPKAIERFGLMPSQKDNVTVDELESIANYMYDYFPFSKQSKKRKSI